MGITQRLFDDAKIEGRVEGIAEGIAEGRAEGRVEGETRGKTLLAIQLAEEGDLDLEKAKSRIESLRSSLQDDKFWEEIDNRLKKLHH